MKSRVFILILSLVLVTGGRGDETGEEIARQHMWRAGGRLSDLRSLYAEGRMLIKDEVAAVRMWAERPNRLRVESSGGDRQMVQCFDGEKEPWLSYNAVAGGAPQRMATPERKDFLANADFDGPLVNHREKGYTVDYAGSESVLGRPAEKILVMNDHDEVFFLWLDVETHEIVKRAVYKMSRGQRVLVDTYYSDFREVGGVPQPHRIETKIGETTLYLMVISRMEANLVIPPERFAAPGGWPRMPPGQRASQADPVMEADPERRS